MASDNVHVVYLGENCMHLGMPGSKGSLCPNLCHWKFFPKASLMLVSLITDQPDSVKSALYYAGASILIATLLTNMLVSKFNLQVKFKYA